MLTFLRQERWLGCALAALVVAIACAVLLPGLGSFGFWDPHEFDVIDRARGSASASPLTAWATRVGFRLVGVNEFGARLPLALMGVAVALLTFIWASHAHGLRVGVYAALLVVASPLVILQSRQLTSSIGLMLGHLALISGGAFVLTCDRPVRVAFGVGLAGLGALLSYYAGGALLGVGVPLAALCVAALATRRYAAALVISLAVAGGGTLAAVGVLSIGGEWRAKAAPLVWSSLTEQIAFGAFPWIAIVPLALVQATRSRSAITGWLAFSWATMAFVACTLFAWKLGPTRYPAVPALALSVAVWLDAVAHKRAGVTVGAIVVVALVVLTLGRDLMAFPDRLASLHLAGKSVRHAGVVGSSKTLPLLLGVGFAGCIVATARLRKTARRRIALTLALSCCIALGVMVAAVWTPGWSRDQSSRHLFEQYSALHSAGETLAVLGVPKRSVDFYAPDAERSSQTGVIRSMNHDRRAFAVLPERSLCAVSQAVRAKGGAVTVIARSRVFGLISNRHLPGEPRVDGLEKLIRSQPAVPKRPVSANFADKIELLGVDMPRRIRRGAKFRLTLYYRVLAKLRRKWKVFVHIDRGGVRISGDHWPISDRCPTQQWNVGDYIVDTVHIDAGNITYAAGRYRVRTGFFVGARGKFTNMKVVSGSGDTHHRIDLGEVQLR